MDATRYPLSPLGKALAARAATPPPCPTCSGKRAVRADGTYYESCSPHAPGAEPCDRCGATGLDHTGAAAQMAHDLFTHEDSDERDRAMSGADAYGHFDVRDELPGEDARDAFVDAWVALASAATTPTPCCGRVPTVEDTCSPIRFERYSIHCPGCYCGCGECGGIAYGATEREAVEEWNEMQAERAERAAERAVPDVSEVRS